MEKRNKKGQFTKVEKINLNCVSCHEEFKAYPSEISRGRKYCSKACQPAWNKGKKGYLSGEKHWHWGGTITPEHKNKMVLALIEKGAWNKGKHTGNHGNGFKRGITPWNKGLKGLVPWNKNKKGLQVGWSKGLKGIGMGIKNGMWKGNGVGYFGLHLWIKRMLGAPLKCVHCGTTNQDRVLQWANISGEYKRDVKDFMSLCVPCHSKYDRARR